MQPTGKLKQKSIHCETVSLPQLSKWRERGESLYAFLDACDEVSVLDIVASLGDRAVSLYRGKAERDFFAIAPYLVEADEGLVETVVSSLAATPWGYFILVPKDCDLAMLRRHFRRFLTVQGPDGNELYFRFYDPRVIKTFLESSSATEVAEFFGPVTRFAILGEAALEVISRPQPTAKE